MKHINEDSMVYDKEELFWINAAKNEELEIDPDSDELTKQLKTAAKNTLRKDARISLRLSSEDVERLKRLAARAGIPYQTYTSSIIHRFLNKLLPIDDLV